MHSEDYLEPKDVKPEFISAWMKDKLEELRKDHPLVRSISCGCNDSGVPGWWVHVADKAEWAPHLLSALKGALLQAGDASDIAVRKREEARKLLAEAQSLETSCPTPTAAQ